MTLDKTIKQLSTAAVLAVGMASTSSAYAYDADTVIKVKYVYGSSIENSNSIAYFTACLPYDTKGGGVCQSLMSASSSGYGWVMDPANGKKKVPDTIYDESWVIGNVYESSFEIKDKQLQRELKIDHAKEDAYVFAEFTGALAYTALYLSSIRGRDSRYDDMIDTALRASRIVATDISRKTLYDLIDWYYEPEKNIETLAPSSKSARIKVDLVYNGNGASFLQRCISYDETGAAYCKTMRGKWIGTPWLRGNSAGYSVNNELAVGPTSHGTMGVMKYEPPSISAAPSRSSASSSGSSSSYSSSSRSLPSSNPSSRTAEKDAKSDSRRQFSDTQQEFKEQRAQAEKERKEATQSNSPSSSSNNDPEYIHSGFSGDILTKSRGEKDTVYERHTYNDDIQTSIKEDLTPAEKEELDKIDEDK